MPTDRPASDAANSHDTALISEMYRALFDSPRMTTKHLLAFNILVRAAGFKPEEIYGE